MEKKLILLLLLCIMLCGVACGGAESTATAVPPTSPPNNPPAEAETISPPTVETEPVANDAATTGCEDYFRFCTTVQVSGTLTADFSSGIGGSIPACADWAAGGDARHLDLPMVQAFEQAPVVIVSLTAVGEYTGPGRYELVAERSGGLPDMFPVLAIGDRTFERGDAATAVAEIAADGSGTLTATGLVEIATLQNSSPDPNAQVDLTMSWTCQEQGG